jgi:hypothetical protein
MNQNEETEQGGWNSLWSILQCRDMHFKDEIEKNRVSLFIHPKRFGCSQIQISSSFSFEKNLMTGKVDLTYCSRKLYEKESRKTFQNCTRFGLAGTGDSIVFEVNCECCDSLLFPHWDLRLSPFNHRIVLHSMNQLIESVDSINRLIEIVLSENQSSLDIA